MSDAFGLAKVGQIAIPVTDIDRAVAFYRDVPGMRFLFQAPPGLGFFDCGGLRLMLDLPAREQAGRGGVIYYEVDATSRRPSTPSPRAAWPSRPSPISSPGWPITSCGCPSSATPTATRSR
jgi:catechol 2,3-dioxygenase-like lactoylglutathione lyase family enzyme